jgi:GT2 family glycosyltransferase
VRLSVVIVCFGGDVAPVLDALHGQLGAGDELIVVDNLAAAGGTAGVRRHPAVDRLLEPPANLHYARGANLGAAGARGDVVVLLNPDAVPQPGFLDALRTAPRAWEAWGGVLLLPGGRLVNNAGGTVHFLGLAWSGRHGEPVDTLPRDPHPAGFLSGGCLAIRTEAWRALGGYAEGYVAYHEDTELSLRLRLEGRGYGIVPAARAEHDYAFDKGAEKWRRLEANRWRTILRTYPAPLLALLAPVLLAAEPVIALAALRGGWGRSKLAAWWDLLRWLPRMPAERRRVQRRAQVSPRAFAEGLASELDSPFLGAPARSAAVRLASRALWRAVLALLAPRGPYHGRPCPR